MNISKIYGHKSIKQNPVVPVPVPNVPPKEKKPQNVLGGMKIHGSHMKRMQFEDGFVDVPKIEYVRLLEEQITAMRSSQREMNANIQRLYRNITKLQNRIQDIEHDLTNKVDLRRKG